ncbi:MAG: DUF2066 domain-containing protein [Gammaproteobacteria bacterium]|jgi:hypothetical protein|nr:DUF2066 domain-containing protein [Gammaproteobacteria bacterium]MBT4194510.1 DUF2066 domain-containing protein [Gammaproteobacteria bacterium]MBT6455663.1 DUF2066 domain-containing protein [Gammaproteobacteria bacterium]MBT6701950.1 DUF2066 domain-containing protein [Gammaproteobacteria bacterium]MBT7047151.1 DUF2066 domain-containing protein [Gammaproteobacteria bacterium]
MPVYVLFLFMGSSLQAAVVDDLYSIELAVADQTTSQRLDIFKQAFRDVIVKVSGSSAVLDHPGLSRPLKSSSRYVHQFRYITRKDESEDSFDGGQLYLRVSFNQEVIENLLRSNDIPVWGKERPGTLLLISYQLNKNTSVVSSDTTPAIVEELDALAHLQGLPVLFPLLDLEDRVQFGVQDIIESNEENLVMAAARYSPDAVLVGQVSGRAGKGWQGIWQLSFSGQLYNWTFKTGSRQELMSQAVSQLAQTLASEYALESVASLDEDILFTVDQVTELTDHIKVLSYLQSLDAIESVRLVLIKQGSVTYRLKLRNSTDDLSRLIALSYVLEQLELPQINAATDDQTILMNYRFIR